MPPKEDAMKSLLETAVLAALDAGRRILEVYESDDFDVEVKGDGSPLTRADKLANESIARALASTALPFLSEEGRTIAYAERRSWDGFWLVDPLDGTKEFLKRNGEFTVNIALVVGQTPRLGVVFAPARGVLYFGDASVASFVVDDAALLARPSTSMADVQAQAEALPRPNGQRPFKIVGSRSHGSPETAAYVESLRAQHPDLEMLGIGSSLKLCMVAEGAADAYPRFAPTMEWDTAAAHAVVLGAGRQVLRYEAGRGTVGPVVYNKEDLTNPWFLVSA
jgi:3'(2'), 5'-bisphosphate nucleotidase